MDGVLRILAAELADSQQRNKEHLKTIETLEEQLAAAHAAGKPSPPPPQKKRDKFDRATAEEDPRATKTKRARVELAPNEVAEALVAAIVNMMPAALLATGVDSGHKNWGDAELNLLYALCSVATPQHKRLAATALHAMEPRDTHMKLGKDVFVLLLPCKAGARGGGTAVCYAVLAAFREVSRHLAQIGNSVHVYIIAVVFGGNVDEIERREDAGHFNKYVRDLDQNTSPAARKPTLALPSGSTVSGMVFGRGFDGKVESGGFGSWKGGGKCHPPLLPLLTRPRARTSRNRSPPSVSKHRRSRSLALLRSSRARFGSCAAPSRPVTSALRRRWCWGGFRSAGGRFRLRTTG